MNNKIIKLLLILLIIPITLTACGTKTSKELMAIKDTMLNDLKNYNYDIKITTNAVGMNIPTTMSCTDDRQSEIVYCKSNTIGIEAEQYFDYKNEKSYTKTSAYGTTTTDWTKEEIKNLKSNAWLDLINNTVDVKSESQNGGTLYKGKINTKKLGKAMSQADTSINLNSILNKDIEIEMFVNSSKYIENIKFNIEILTITEEVEITFKDYNTAGSVEIPNNLK